MKVYVLSDMECVAGIVNFVDYCRPESSRYYDHGCKLATAEVNAAIEGLLEAGATEIVVRDGHGPGGLNPSLLHPEARIATGRPMDYPHFLDDSFDAMIIVGQHAKANADGGHLCHSGSFDREDWLLNGESVGEIALNVLTASYFDVPTVMLSGDQAACDEIEALVSPIETVAVIEGQKRGSTAGMTVEQCKAYNCAAVHLAPARAQSLIREAARRCLDLRDKASLYSLEPPYEMIRVRRHRENGGGERAVSQADDFLELLAMPAKYV